MCEYETHMTYQGKHLTGREAESTFHTSSAYYGTDSSGAWDSLTNTPDKRGRMQLKIF